MSPCRQRTRYHGADVNTAMRDQKMKRRNVVTPRYALRYDSSSLRAVNASDSISHPAKEPAMAVTIRAIPAAWWD